MPQNRKICSLDRLLALRADARAAGRRIVQCHGCFDIVHPGHIRHLQFARSLGDILLVSVSSDAHVNKGINRPLIPDDLRAGSLAALECVDWVYINPHPTAVDLLEQTRPDIYVKGREYERNRDPRFLAERETVHRHGGRIVFSSDDIVFSSTALIGQLESQDAFNSEKVRHLRDRHGLGANAMHHILGGMRGLKFVVAGDYILDRYHFCDATGVAGEAPMMSLRALDTRSFDGGAAVIALHLAGLGAHPTLITALADDPDAGEARLRLAEAGVELHTPARRDETIRKRRYLVDQNKLFKVDEGRAAPLDSQTEAAVAERILAAAEGADGVIFADFGYGLITAGLLDRIMPELRRKVNIIAADVSGQQSNLLRFREVDLLCPTEREIRQTLHDFTTGLGAVVSNLLTTTRARRAIITLGKQGLVTFEPPAGDLSQRLLSEYIPALSSHAIDPLGCGDALLATAAAALAAGASLPAAAFLGSLAGAAEVQLLGNQPLTTDRLLHQLQLHDHASALRIPA